MHAIPSFRWVCSGCRRNGLSKLSSSAYRIGHVWRTRQRPYSVSSHLLSGVLTEIERTRNIGIIAHIDAGKTTTTERMLYYSGFTRSIGDVDDGSTVTDFLPAERARGITIQSAAITFNWPPTKSLPDDGQVDTSTLPTVDRLREQGLPRSSVPHVINLIDTPGHADFTFEVLRSLRILDGAVCILDGVAGVEAQTEKVWHQASRYNIPRIVFVNKLDREGAAFGRTVKEIGSKLAGWPVVCQIPWFEKGEGRFQGVGDAINLRALFYAEGGDGRQPVMYDLEHLKTVDPALADEIKKARVALVELLSEQDDQLVECFLEKDGDHLAVEPLDIIDSLRRCLRRPSTRVIPVFAGASFKNIGVQPLLDAVINLLPSPTERPDPEVTIGHTKGGLEALLSGSLEVEESGDAAPGKRKKGKTANASTAAIKFSLAKLEACALAFKVVNDPKRGVLVYVRVYSGEITRNAALFNTSLQLSERGPRLLKMYANDAVEVASVKAGNIAVITGLKFARTGDTLLQFPGNKPTPPHPLNTLQLRPIDVPSAVFFASVEPHSLAEEKNLHEALALLLREDPSLHVTQDQESGQTLLSGMGELHLEIARDRLVKDLKAKASMGSISIGYRECISQASTEVSKIWDKDVAGKKSKAGCTSLVEPLEYVDVDKIDGVWFTQMSDGNRVTVVCPELAEEKEQSHFTKTSDALLPSHLNLATLKTALVNGAVAALARGPNHAYPMHNAHVRLTFIPPEHLFGSDSTPTAISAAARTATQAALREVAGSATLMEPVMNVTISVNEASMGSVIHDISSARGGHILSLDEDDDGATAGDGGGGGAAAAEIEVEAFVEDGTADLPPIDLSKVYAPRDPSGAAATSSSAEDDRSKSHVRQIRARVPLKEMVGYLKHLRSLTAGRGTFVMSVDRFEKMSGQRVKALLTEWNEGMN